MEQENKVWASLKEMTPEMQSYWKTVHPEMVTDITPKSPSFKKAIEFFTDKKHLAEQFLRIQPLYYDDARLWWMWDDEEKYWQVCDDTDILNMISENSLANTINSKERGEILEALRQCARKYAPEAPKKTWLQFKDMIVDCITDEEIIPSPQYFITNPIPYKLASDDATPIMDSLFTDWVGAPNVRTLYEIIAYSILADYPINRIFCFIGSGSNGKSKYLSILRKFVGENNVCSTELDTLIQSRFEVTKLHKKLVCQMGETNFGELSKTSLLKKLSGGDLIGFEYKNKNPFEDVNYAKILISTNNLPATTDKTIGFYRRWMIIDFPNTFTEQEDILAKIPEQEYQNLTLKCVRILKTLLTQRTFTNEGTVEERMQKYEAKSNFIEKFIKDFTKEDINGYITKSEFYKRFSEWSKENRHRDMSETSVGLSMKKQGIEEGRKHFDWLYDGKGGYARIWVGITWK